MKMLEGPEIEKSYDDGAGKVVLDVDATGKVSVSNVYEKDINGYAKVKSITEVETNIFILAEKIAAKTKTTLDDKAIAGLKAILGIGKEEEQPADQQG